MKVNKFNLAVLLLLPAMGLAKHVLPVFSGYWYDSSKVEYLGLDNCDRRRYFYKSDPEQGTAEAVANHLLQNPPPHTDCTWQRATLKNTDDYRPADFDSSGNYADWDKIRSTTGFIPCQTWSRSCLNNSGLLIDDMSVRISPQYTCPSNARYGMDLYEKGDGCTTQPVVCDMDVVGRDMDVKLIGGIAGHVGLSSAGFLPPDGGAVFEVLDSISVLQINDLHDFKTRTQHYWGEKFGLPNRPQNLDWLSLDNVISMLQSIDDLLKCSKITYSVNPEALHPCQPDEKGVETAVLRCDYFVNYLYAQAGVPLVDFKFYTRPRTIFDSLTSFRLSISSFMDILETATISNPTDNSEEMGNLRVNKAFDQTDRLIHLYHESGQSLENRNRILDTLEYFLEQSETDSLAYKKVHGFLSDLIKTETDLELLAQVLAYYIPRDEQFMDEQEAVWSRKEIDLERLKAILSAKESFFSSRLSLILAQPQVYEGHVKSLIQLSEASHKNLLVETLSVFLANPEKQKRIHLDQMSTHLRETLLALIEQHKPEVDPDTFLAHGIRMNALTSWYYAQAVMHAGDFEKGQKEFVEALRAVDNLPLKTALIVGASPRLFVLLPVDLLQEVEKALRHQLEILKNPALTAPSQASFQETDRTLRALNLLQDRMHNQITNHHPIGVSP